MVRLRFYSLVLLAGLMLALTLAARPQDKNKAAPSAQQSTITVRVSKAGLFSGFAHNHIVVAPIARATMDPAHMTAEITVATKEMKVKDSDVSEKDRAQIQTTMLGPKVLDTEKFPEIHFKSSRIESKGPQHYRVTGTLTLHGASKELSFEVTGGPEPGSPARAGVARDGVGEHYHGVTKLKQTSFGIKPISLAGGSIKVKDEVGIEFDVYPQAPIKMERR